MATQRYRPPGGVGHLAVHPSTLEPDEAMAATAGVRIVPRWHASPDPLALGHVLDLVAGGDVRVEIARRFRLDDVVAAHRFAQTEHPRGKVVLTVG